MIKLLALKLSPHIKTVDVTGLVLVRKILATITLACMLVTPQLLADDTEIYDELARCLVEDKEKYRFIFIVDNSGSMSSWEFSQSRTTINATINEVLNSDLQDVQVGVVQFGTSNTTKEHKYTVSVPFTNDITVATDWDRHYGPGSPLPDDLQDHLPASFSKMRLDSIYDPGGPLDITDGTNVQFVLFTDALRDTAGSCCSSLFNSEGTNQGDLSNVLPGFGEYDALKSGEVLPGGLNAQITILHVPAGGVGSAEAAAAIASPGGEYIGGVEYNAGDPEGPGTTPRRYVQGQFSVDDTNIILELIQQVIEEIKIANYVSVAPAISVNAFNELQHRNELYFSVFQPGKRPRWDGNVKKYRISGDGVILDANEEPAIIEETGSIAETARSYWSDNADGAAVELGGYREQLTNSRVIYTDQHAIENSLASTEPVALDVTSKVNLELMGMATESASGMCVLVGEKEKDTLTVNAEGIKAVSELPVLAGGVKLSFTTSSLISAKVTINPRLSTLAPTVECENDYSGGLTVHSCEFAVDAGTKSIDLYFAADDLESTVEYRLEYNIAAAGTETSCGTLDTEREDYISWLLGTDVFNQDGDDSNTDAHQFVSDPLHSKPFVVTYSGSSVESAKDVLFITDNLGMLHAIDPADDKGSELWAYLPAEHLDNIKKVILNKAGRPKVYGLDGHVTVVQREQTGSSRGEFNLREVKLYIGERRGGRNYHSIDVSNAASLADNKPTLDWKIIGGVTGGFEDLGQTWSSMLPNRMAYNCDAFGRNCEYREVLIFSGGYDPAYDDASQLPTGTLGNALYIVDLATGGDEYFWSAGNNTDLRDDHIHDLSLPVEHSMVSTPTPIDINGDGAVDILFGMDISGKLWRVDFDGTKSTATTTSALGGNIADLQGYAGIKRFFNSLDITRSNPRSGSNRFTIATGSGYRAHPLDMVEDDNKIFIVFDPNTNSLKSGTADDSELYRYVDGDRAIMASDLIETTSGTEASKYGYQLSATAAGEKFLQPSVTMNGTMIVSSYVPPNNEVGECSTGTGRTYFLNSNNLKSKIRKAFVELKLPGIPPETAILRLPKVTVCVGTACASADSGSGNDVDDCNPDSFSTENFRNDFAAGVAATTCGLQTGRAHRAEWVEY